MIRARATLCLLLAITACPGKPNAPPARTPQPSSASAQPGIRGGTLHVSLTQDVDAIDPQRAGAPASFGLARAMHRGLMAFPSAAGADGSRPVPDLAEADPQISPDGLRFTFTLRTGIEFGAPASREIRAADVKAGLERIFRARSPFSVYFRVIGGADAFAAGTAPTMSGVTTPDERTVVIQLGRPANDFLWLLSLPAASAVPVGLSPTARPRDISPSGPYRLAGDGYVAERSIHLVRNDAWSEATDPVRKAFVDEIRYDIGRSPADIARRIASGATDLAGDALPAGTATAGIPVDRIIREPQGCLRYLFMNTRVAPFDSSRVRAGVAAAIDRHAVAATYGAEGATPAASILPPTVDGHPESTGPPPSPDPARARTIIGSGGFATRLVVGDTAIDRAQASAVRTALARAGVRVAVAVVPIASVYEDYYEPPGAGTPMGIATWCADWPGLGGRGALAPLVGARAFGARENTNYSNRVDPTVQRAIGTASVERDPARAAADWAAADRLALSGASVVPLAFPVEISLLGARIRGFVPHPFFVRGDPTAVWIVGS